MAQATATPSVQWRQVPCAFCGGTETKFFGHQGWSWPTHDERCVKCGLIFLQPRPVLDDAYMEAVYSEDEGAPPVLIHYNVDENFTLDMVKPKEWLRYAESLEAIIAAHPQPGTLLDIGTGNGMLLHLAEKRGWKGVGIEASDRWAGVCRKQFHLDVRTGTLETVRLESDSVDALSLRHVLEHVEDPVAMVLECRRVLRAGGVLLIEVPNPVSLDTYVRQGIQKLFGRRRTWPEGRLPMHMFEFPPKVLAAKVVSLGFELVWSGSYSHADKHHPLVHTVLRAYHRTGWGTKTRLVLRKT